MPSKFRGVVTDDRVPSTFYAVLKIPTATFITGKYAKELEAAIAYDAIIYFLSEAGIINNDSNVAVSCNMLDIRDHDCKKKLMALADWCTRELNMPDFTVNTTEHQKIFSTNPFVDAYFEVTKVCSALNLKQDKNLRDNKSLDQSHSKRQKEMYNLKQTQSAFGIETTYDPGAGLASDTRQLTFSSSSIFPDNGNPSKSQSYNYYVGLKYDGISNINSSSSSAIPYMYAVKYMDYLFQRECDEISRVKYMLGICDYADLNRNKSLEDILQKIKSQREPNEGDFLDLVLEFRQAKLVKYIKVQELAIKKINDTQKLITKEELDIQQLLFEASLVAVLVYYALGYRINNIACVLPKVIGVVGYELGTIMALHASNNQLEISDKTFFDGIFDNDAEHKKQHSSSSASYRNV